MSAQQACVACGGALETPPTNFAPRRCDACAGTRTRRSGTPAREIATRIHIHLPAGTRTLTEKQRR